MTDPSHRYLLVEVADECRHSTMFGEYIRRAGTPAYAPVSTDALGDVDTLPGGRAMGYLLILAVEELLDICNRATMRDEHIHPVVAPDREAARARRSSPRQLRQDLPRRALADASPPRNERPPRTSHPIAVAFVAELMVNDRVYETLGIPNGADAARTNPHHRARIVADLAKLTDFLTELGVIDDDNRPEWVERGLAA